MDLKNAGSSAEVIGTAIVAALLIWQRVRTGSRNTWRDEAEAFSKRSERLAEDVGILIVEVKELRTENAALRVEVAALRVENTELRTHIDSLLGRD